MKTSILLAGILTFAGLQTYAQSIAEKHVIRYADFKETPSTVWDATIAGSKGYLYYFGALHKDDPSDAQFARILEAFTTARPTVVFYEGPDRGIAETDTATIRKFGESGYVRFLAGTKDLKTVSLEPQIKDTYRYLTGKFGQMQVDVYMLTKEAMRLRTRKQADKAELEKQTTGMMAAFPKMTGLNLSINSLESLSAAFQKLFGTDVEWWNAPANWYDPLGDQSILTNKINAASSEYRNIYMAETLSAYVNRGERIFAVVGRNHVPMQEPALRVLIR